MDGEYQISEEGLRRTQEINYERWKPYDETAWDSMCQQVFNLLSQALPLYDEIDRLMRDLLMLLPEPDNDKMQHIHESVEHYLAQSAAKAKLRDSLNPVKIKTELWWSDN